jgi:hypothetical protein
LEYAVYGAACLSALYLVTLTVAHAWHSVKHAHHRKVLSEFGNMQEKE